MAAEEGMAPSALRVLEEALGVGLTSAGATAEAVAAEGAYYLERILGCASGRGAGSVGAPPGRPPRRGRPDIPAELSCFRRVRPPRPLEGEQEDLQEPRVS